MGTFTKENRWSPCGELVGGLVGEAVGAAAGELMSGRHPLSKKAFDL